MSWQDVGRLLLSSDAVEFGGKLLEISEEPMSAGRKGGPPSGPSGPKAGIGARGGRSGLGFAVPRQAARKQTAKPVERGATPGNPKLACMEILQRPVRKVRMISGRCLGARGCRNVRRL